MYQGKNWETKEGKIQPVRISHFLTQRDSWYANDKKRKFSFLTNEIDFTFETISKNLYCHT